MRSWVVGMRKDSSRHPRQCCDVSKVSEANWCPLTAMSSRCSHTATQRALAQSKTLTSWVPKAESQDAKVLWLSQPHHPEVMAAPLHARKASQWKRVSPPCLGGEREVPAPSPISLIGNGGISGAGPI